MTLIERLAKTHYEQLPRYMGDGDPYRPWAEVGDATKEQHRKMARSLLEAARSPDMNIVRNLSRELRVEPFEIDLAYTRYIDAVLKEGK